MPTPIRRRWLPRFGLRTLLIVVTAICVLLGSVMMWYRSQEIEYHRQDELCRRLLDYHASVTWMPTLPGWLKGRLGEYRAFHRIWAITTTSADPKEIKSIMEIVPSLPNLKYFIVTNPWRSELRSELAKLGKQIPGLRIQSMISMNE